MLNNFFSYNHANLHSSSFNGDNMPEENIAFSEQEILDILSSHILEYFTNSVDIYATSDEAVFFDDYSFLKLTNFNAIICGKGELCGKFLLSADNKIAKKILDSFMSSDEYEQNEEFELTQSCIGEALNIVLGNLTAMFDKDYNGAGFTSPEIYDSSLDIEKIGYSNIIGYIIHSDSGDYTLAYTY